MSKIMSLTLSALLLAGCASNPPQQPEIARISPEELERIMPKPVPNLSLDEIVRLSKAKTPAAEIIEKIRGSNSRYDLSPSQALDLSKQGVPAEVLDYIHKAREQALRDSIAEEINKRELEKQREQEKLRREYRWRSQQFYDPFWYGYGGFGPYWRYRPFYGYPYWGW